MTITIDHVFVCSQIGAPEADDLIDFGLTEGTPNRHAGQGTANRRFFFENAMLELLWVEDPDEAQNEMTRSTKLCERWSNRDDQACPFGICFRPANRHDASVPFPAWQYRAHYLPAPSVIHIGADTPLSEPMWFYLSFAKPPAHESPDRRQTLQHPIGFHKMTGVEITLPKLEDLSSVSQFVADNGLVTFASGTQHLLELTFDDSTQGRAADFRPNLPLIFRW